MVNGFVTAGLVYLRYKKGKNWSSPWHTVLPISLLYLAANILLAIVPFIPPDGAQDPGPNGYSY